MVALRLGRSGGGGHRRGDLREDRADRGRNARHDCTCGDGHKARHQRVFDKVLALGVLQDLNFQDKIFDAIHSVSSPTQPVCIFVSAAISNVSSGTKRRISKLTYFESKFVSGFCLAANQSTGLDKDLTSRDSRQNQSLAQPPLPPGPFRAGPTDALA